MKTAFLYAGQGSQKRGMGKDLYEAYPEFREAFDVGSLPFDLHTLCFEDPENQLAQTEYTQPALTAFACGVTNILYQRGIRPEYVAGLSLGEYSALQAAGVFDAKTAIELTAFRGAAMAEASKGIETGMYAVLGLEEGPLLECCKQAEEYGVVSISNYNCPGQLVIGGAKEAVDVCAKLAKEAGAKRCLPLKVSGPFHTSLMQPAGEALKKHFQSMTFGEMKIPVLFNCLGRENTENVPIGELLVKQVQTSVRMEATIRRLFELGVDTFVEIGPGEVLSGFVKKTAKALGIQEYTCICAQSAEDMEALPSIFAIAD